MIEEILADKRAEVAALNASMIRSVRPSTRDLAYAVGAGRESMSLLVEVKHEGPAWKVSSWAPDTGQFKPRPVSSTSVPIVISAQRPAPTPPVPPPATEQVVPKADPPEARP